MEEELQIQREPQYTLRWLGLRTLFVLLIAGVLAIIASTIDGFASVRVNVGSLSEARYTLLSQSIPYCFCVIAITLFSLTMIEVAFRKNINYLQHALIEMALTLFYLLLLSISELLVFGASYLIVTVMTVGLIAVFVNAITKKSKAVGVTTGILAVEYSLLFILVELGSMALLIGSLTLFVIIALSMYFTLKLKVEDEELIIK